MKLTKFFALIMAILMISSMACIFVSAEGDDEEEDAGPVIVGETGIYPDYVLFDFTVAGMTGVGDSSAEANNALFWGKAKRFGTEYDADGKFTSLIFSATNQTEIDAKNPYATAMLPEDLTFDAATYSICKIRYKANTAAENSTTAMFFGIDGRDGFGINGYWAADTQVLGVEIIDENYQGETMLVQNDGEWHDLYFDMTNNALWDGTVTCIRYDFLWEGAIAPGDSVDVQYIAFLKNTDDALSFQYDTAKDEFNFECTDEYVSPLAALDENNTEEETTTADEEVTTAADEEEVTTAAEEEEITTEEEEVTTAAEEEVTTAAEEITTVAETEAETEAATTAAVEEATTAATAKKGCGSVVAGGSVAMVALLALAGYGLKKKEN